MSEHNYYQTFISVAEDSAVEVAQVPRPRGSAKTVAELQFEMLHDQSFVHTQEDVLFGVWLARQPEDDRSADEIAILRDQFFAKPQPCLRTSALAKTYGWGFLFDEQGKVALRSVESSEYETHLNDERIKQLRALRSKKAK